MDVLGLTAMTVEGECHFGVLQTFLPAPLKLDHADRDIDKVGALHVHVPSVVMVMTDVPARCWQD